ncbi:universal stress protein [Sinomicrobium pectinilyticum]|uniref:Universal stress protein n=1 Tax=Sinomicrobium pectinilyticum TaxID=1084421 RepID=A0A3N0DHZ3_SINP1|nr:universal stress protein [Sinomicrobium pectinilyticum]RNL75289.1 universal stress protein [Sinomicrobium pectinilyticum]
MMKKILLPTDFSDNAWNAIVYALKMFKDESCEFHVLHTYYPAFYEADYYEMIDDTLTGLRSTMDKIEKEFPNTNHRFYSRSDFDLLTDEIRDITEEQHTDMIVMGTKGATGARRILFGSNTVFVMRKATIPVLAVPDEYGFKGIKRILFATDYLKLYKREELYPLIDIAEKHGAKITVFHVDHDMEPEKNEEKVQELLLDLFKGTDFDFITVLDQEIPEAIRDHIEDHHYDVLAMVHRKYSFIERLLLRQNVENLGFHLDIPLLVLRSKEDT